MRDTGVSDLRRSLASQTARRFAETGHLVATRELDSAEIRSLRNERAFEEVYSSAPWSIVVEHERIGFPSYPHEWPAEMLYAAGCLTLELARTLIDEGMGLKDATPYNILFRGSAPVLVDLLSFETRAAADSIWLPYAQFMRTFVLPLLASKHFGLSPQQAFARGREGLEPEDLYRLSSVVQRLRPAFLGTVTVPALLAPQRNRVDPPPNRQTGGASTPEKARFILEGVFAHLQRSLDAARPRAGRPSRWAGYTAGDHSIHPEVYHAGKRSFVKTFCEEQRIERVLDVGCNDGHVSVIAAKSGARVVAIDSDAVMVGEVWRKAVAERLDILSLVVDLTNPTPGTGWRNSESSSFLSRAAGHFDAVLFLGVLHHLLVSGAIPLDEIVGLAAELTTAFVVMEYVPPDDRMFRYLARGRDAQYAFLTRPVFESACRRYFDVVKVHETGTGRIVYLLRKLGR